MNLKLEYNKILEEFELNLKEAMKIDLKYEKLILESMSYSLFSGGKRLRPILLLKVCQLFTNDYSIAIPYSIAIEMIHTYSLIHDDLPSMDDDKFRRGKLTNHLVYGEANAILAGDALLNLAFEIMLKDLNNNGLDKKAIENRIRAISEIATYSGIQGMIGGQVIDLAGSDIIKDENILMYMYKKKTAALIQASMVAGALLGNAKVKEIQIIREMGKNLGLAFQIKDDILDEKEDKKSEKLTFLNYYTSKKAKALVEQLSNKAEALLEQLNKNKTTFIKGLIRELNSREK